MIFWRVVQGAGAAIMFPAALAIVVSAYPREERGRAMAAFFGIAGGLTAIGPLAGGFLIEMTWRAIFWINVPVAIAAIMLTLKAKPDDTRRPAPLDYRGAVLAALGPRAPRTRPPAVEPVGLGQPRHLGLDHRRPGADRRSSSASSSAPTRR